MITLYCEKNRQIVCRPSSEGLVIPNDVVWIDLFQPTREEELAVETFLGTEIPTIEEMREIEISNRLYQENNALFMTVTVVKADLPEPETHAITFVLCERVLVSIRYVDILPFKIFAEQVKKRSFTAINGTALLLELLDCITDRIADILERVGHDIDDLTKDIFHRNGSNDKFTALLKRIAVCGDSASKVHESLVTLSRMVAFIAHHKNMPLDANDTRITAVNRDIVGLGDHTTYLTGKVNFLLDATLGMISIEQNTVFRVLSVASLVFMPPTLIAGVYGMNFKLLPELNWHWGYPMALALMVFSAVLPYAYLKQRKML